MKSFILYSTLGCHLCERAKQLLQMCAERRPIPWREQDIIEEEALLERYGVRIPVLKAEQSGEELGWPFDGEELQSWLEKQSAT